MRRDPHGSQLLAEMYAAGGSRDEAIQWLRNAIALGVRNVPYMTGQISFFASLRNDAEFNALMSEVRGRMP
jgi:hypothetical protein